MKNLMKFSLSMVLAIAMISFSQTPIFAQACGSCTGTLTVNAISQNIGANVIGKTTGVYGQAKSGGVGVYGRVINNNGTAVFGKGTKGIYGYTSGTPGSYAGYFVGNVRVTGVITQGSDQKLKRNINPVRNALSTVLQLDAKSYEFQTSKYNNLGLAEGLQYGFIAQELEAVLPELVTETEHEAIPEIDENGEIVAKENKTTTYKSVNYIALIPILTEAIKEQQEMISDLQETVEKLSNSNPQINRRGVGAVLKQNAPNPFSNETTIQFDLPQEFTNAELLIHDMQGKQLKKYTLDGNANSVSVNARELGAGMYAYSLVIDNEIISTLKMVLTE